MQFVGILEHLGLNHAVRLHVVNLAFVLLVVFWFKTERRFTNLGRLNLAEIGFLFQEFSLDFIEVELPARVVDKVAVHIQVSVLGFFKCTLVAHELD